MRASSSHMADHSVVVPPALRKLLPGDGKVRTAEALRVALVELGHCRGDGPAVTVELYGGLRLKAGCRTLPLRAHTVGEAVAVLRRVCPALDRMMPDGAALVEHYRFAVNGSHIVRDLAHPLHEGDRLILFDASVGG